MSDKFTDVYFQISNESVFKDKKWLKTENIFSIQIFENYKHLEERLFDRYHLHIKEWLYWLILKSQITNKFIELNLWSKASKKPPYQRSFTIHLTISNMWLSGIIQNDIDDGEKRIYFSTFLPKDPTINKRDIKLDFPL